MPAGIYYHGQREISVAPIREAFHASDLTAYEVARRLEWRKGPAGYPDAGRVKRTLGIVHNWEKRTNRPYVQVRCSYATAMKLVTAIGLDPTDLGL